MQATLITLLEHQICFLDPQKHLGSMNELNYMTRKAECNIYVEFSTLIPKSSLLNITFFFPYYALVAELYLHCTYSKAWLDVVCLQFMTKFIEFYIPICNFKTRVFSDPALKIHFHNMKSSNNPAREYLNSSVSLRSHIHMLFETTLMDNSVYITTFHKRNVHHTLNN